MIETGTRWEDSGYDCSHCGGEILKRYDHETGQPDQTRLQCKQCGCQWSLDGQLVRVGKEKSCKDAGHMPVDVPPWLQVVSRRLWLLIALIAGVILLRFGGMMMFRLLLPAILVGFVAYSVVKFGREQAWW